MEKVPLGYIAKIKEKIDNLLAQHNRAIFARWLETERIVYRPSYRLPLMIHPMNNIDMIGDSLYQAEEDMNPRTRFGYGIDSVA